MYFTAAHCFWVDGLPQNIRINNHKYMIAAGKYGRNFAEMDKIHTQTSAVCI